MSLNPFTAPHTSLLKVIIVPHTSLDLVKDTSHKPNNNCMQERCL